MQTLSERFQEFCKTVDAPRGIEPAPITHTKPELVKLYNIFKRSLPAGLNKLVFQNITEGDINLLFKKTLRPITKQDQPIIYWDAVEAGTTEEWDVYSNQGIDTVGEGGNINTYREGKEEMEDWKD